MNETEGIGGSQEPQREMRSEKKASHPLPLEAHKKFPKELGLIGKSEGIRSPEVISGPTSVSEVGISVLGTERAALSETQKTAAARMDTYLESMRDNAFFSGTVLVKQGDTVILRKGYGQATAEVPNGPSTVFQIGSVTKQFTAAAIMKLVEKGKIDLHAPINNYLPDAYKPNKWNDVTVHQLLSHTSGIHEFGDREDYDIACKDMTVEGELQEARKKELDFRPGEEHRYSNTGYHLLGKIIHEVSGSSYRQFIEEEILAPANMTSSGVIDESYKPSAQAAIGLTFNEQKTALEEEKRSDFHLFYASGAIFSTVDDLAKWSQVLDGGTLVLGDLSIERMKTPVLSGYGYGLRSGEEHGQRFVSHAGGVSGFVSEFSKYPDSDFLVVVLSNSSATNSSKIKKDLSQICIRPEEPIAAFLPFPPDFNYSQYTHAFRSENEEFQDVEFTFSWDLEHHQLMCSFDFSPPEPCKLLSNGRVYFCGEEFRMQADGRISCYDGTGNPEPFDILNRA